ncbi:hypothetical protein [Pedobacter metabolipauper]|uniref:WD40 repeat protein n=1 Tax=Pedobacter metabolipauper TaxID=425513 RepID=A0A4V3D118_9SPHI|nr:hypothetical protein [Pedobacter metabolipauper]TDQ08654.1 hypothetical protein ATK78_3170 [Pedobacter metabolipauper]
MRRFIFKPFILCFALLLTVNFSKAQHAKPVIKVDVAGATADKPQSKLWFMDGSWWALLPKSSGPSLWQRTSKGWIEDPLVSKHLTGYPGRVDVWANDHEVMAVGVASNYLSVYQLKKDKKSWQVKVMGKLSAPKSADNDIETATIVQDKTGCWWVAADVGDQVYVWKSVDGNHWNEAVELGNGINKDDISTLTILPGGIGLIWTDQNQDAVKFRFHEDNRTDWNAVEIIEQGNHTADDHLRSSVSPDGTLWLATKNSVDEIGKPQLVLRVRHIDGKWKNYPFANLDSIKKPSRPAVLTTPDTDVVFIGYTEYNAKDSNLGVIKFARVNLNNKNVIMDIKTVIKPEINAEKNTLRINDITSSKDKFPKNGPWIILASDQLGNIYEADLRADMK